MPVGELKILKLNKYQISNKNNFDISKKQYQIWLTPSDMSVATGLWYLQIISHIEDRTKSVLCGPRSVVALVWSVKGGIRCRGISRETFVMSSACSVLTTFMRAIKWQVQIDQF